jgi:hypothetical protein
MRLLGMMSVGSVCNRAILFTSIDVTIARCYVAL